MSAGDDERENAGCATTGRETMEEEEEERREMRMRASAAIQGLGFGV